MLPQDRQLAAVKRFEQLVASHHYPKNATAIVAREFGVTERSVYNFRARAAARPR